MTALCNKTVTRLHLFTILLLGMIAYANSLCVPLQVDDRLTIRVSIGLNSQLFSLPAFLGMNRWFADLTFALNRLLHGERVFGYHLVNLTIHLAAAVVVYLFVQQAFMALRRTFHGGATADADTFSLRFIPFATAALFVCHPVQTEAVTYISQRYTSLATLFYVSSLLSYLAARRALAEQPLQARLWGGVCLLLALLALKSKEIAFTLPLMLAACEAALFRGELLKKRLLLFLGAALLLVVPLEMIHAHGVGSSGNLLGRMQAATADTVTIARGDYLLTQFRVVATYLRLLILPLDQNWDYDYPLSHTLLEPRVCSALLLHLALAALAVALFRRSRRRFAAAAPEAGIAWRLAALGIGWFYLALSVESSVMPIRDVMVEHRLYLPSIGFFMAVAAAMARFVVPSRRIALWCGLALLCGVFTAATIARNRVWGDEMTLWRDVVRKSPDKARPRVVIGALYVKKMMPEEALRHFVRAVELDPAWDMIRMNINLTVGAIDRFKGRGSDGTQYLAADETVKPPYQRPWLALSYNNLGLAYEYLGNQFLARENFIKAATVNPALDLAWYNLALAAAYLDDNAATAAALERLNSLNPSLARDAAQMISSQQRAGAGR
jgi:tetratricopeptide (TPR) repeat protein